MTELSNQPTPSSISPTAPAEREAEADELIPLPNDLQQSLDSFDKLFLSGPFGSGKTTAAVARVRWLLAQERIRGDDIIVIVPQRTIAQPYLDALRSAAAPPGPPVRITTLSGLARESIELYWPLLSTTGGFEDARREPTFLNLETSQYHMARLVDAAIARAEFDGIRIERSRVITQVLDNLNKAALHRFTIDEAYERLELAVPGGEQRTARLNALRAAQRISHEFRSLCLRETLIDFSLQIELFNRQVLVQDWSRTHLFRSHRHLVFDNVEEGNSAAHNLARQWIPEAESALVVMDEGGGYRVFLGAAPQEAQSLASVCGRQMRLTETHIMSPPVQALVERVNVAIQGQRAAQTGAGEDEANPFAPEEADEGANSTTSQDAIVETAPDSSMEAITVPNIAFRFYPQMIDWAVGEIAHLVHEEGVPPGQIAILAPFVSDAMRFSLDVGLTRRGIELTSHRPSRALEDEPSTRALLTLAALAHPDWGVRPPPSDVTLTLSLTIHGLDPVRAHLLSRIVYPPRRSQIELGRFGDLVAEMQGRITYTVGERFDTLREWIYAYRASGEITPLDQFFARLFGEVLSQPGFGFHDDYDAARVANQLVESARNFRWALEEQESRGVSGISPAQLGREYLSLVESGAVGALYVPGWREAEDAVFLAPAYTFLMRNRPMEVQFWLDIGSGGWWERLYQPLTHPYVLSQAWPAGQPWTDRDEWTTRQDTMRRLLLGLIRRTRRQVYLGMSDYSESGFEQRGPLLALINRLLAQG